jgi:hypothetical protein
MTASIRCSFAVGRWVNATPTSQHGWAPETSFAQPQAFAIWMPGVLMLFSETLAELDIRHIRTQVNSAWTNDKDVHLCEAATSALSVLNRVLARSIAQSTSAACARAR